MAVNIGSVNQNNTQRSTGVVNQPAQSSGRGGFNPQNNINAQLATVLLLLLALIQQIISQLQQGGEGSDGSDGESDQQGSGDELQLSSREEDAISQRFNDNSPLAFDGLATQFTGRSFDDNGDGELSAGDSIELRRFGGNAIPPTDFVELYTLTADDVATINTSATQPLLNLNDEQSSRLQQAVLRQDIAFIPGDGPRLDSVIDSNGDGQLSVGDTLKIVDVRGFETGNPTTTASFETLTQEQFDRFEAGIAFNPSEMPPPAF